jgi:Fe-S-cluster containining protein
MTDTSTPEPLAAGVFSQWLEGFLASLPDGENDVPCGDCIGCCSSSYFIHVTPEDKAARAAIPKKLLFKAPGLPRGNHLLGHDEKGHCPMLHAGTCTIYAVRPGTCRRYDCRIFAAAGIAAGDEEARVINERVRRWSFEFPTPRDRDLLEAVRKAAAFLQEHAEAFPGGRVPTQPSQLALAAVRAHEVFLRAEDGRSPQEIAREVMEKSA